MAPPVTRKRTGPVDNGGEGRPRKRKRTKKTRRGTTAQPKPALPEQETAPRTTQRGPAIRHDLLARYYPRVETLRAYLLTRLPSSSRIRRKKLGMVGKAADPSAVEQLLSHLLDTVLVACVGDDDPNGQQALDRGDRQQLRETFSQNKRADESYVTISDGAEGTFSPQAEIVDFVVWFLFKRAKRIAGSFPDNVLCHGFQTKNSFGFRDAAVAACAKPDAYPCSIHELYAAKPTQNAQTLKEAPWPQLLALLGASGKNIMTNLLLDCSLFLPVDAGYGNYIQLTGKPLCDILVSDMGRPEKETDVEGPTERQLSDVMFVRSRMFYANPSATAAGSVHFGLKHIHVLNRFPYRHQLPQNAASGQTLVSMNKAGTIHTAMYIFPRQFGLHNVFTSVVDRQTTAQKFQDYTMREKEISEKFGNQKQHDSDIKIPIPKRLRGMPLALVDKMRILHGRCAYYALLEHYCPVCGTTKLDADAGPEAPLPTEPVVTEATGRGLSSSEDAREAGEKPAQMKDRTQVSKDVSMREGKTPLVQLATPLSQVSAFCQAVFKNVVPDGFWGSGDVQAYNKTAILKKVDTFIRLLRYETLNLHGLLQGLKISEIEWLAPPALRGKKMSETDLQKRQEIFAELLYYLFDSILIPLVRSNFYVTESNTHRNRLFYFRHDIWQRISQPAMVSLKASRFEEVKPSDAARIMDSRDLGYGHIRLLPKQSAMRTIMNLRRRVAKEGDTRLESSTNTVLGPVAAMLNFEMKQHPERLGSAMLSIRSMYTRLKEFKQRLGAKKQVVFYFAKVDVKSAFDTIPQEAMVKLIGSVPSHPVYSIDKHVEISAPEKAVRSSNGPAPSSSYVPGRAWRSVAKANGDKSGFHDSVENTFAPHKRNTVFVDTAFRKTRDAESLATLAAAHIKQNIIKIGKKYYRQKDGIPQGSILSSALCNYFYADLEEKELGFLKNDPATEEDNDCLLLRLIDDFLLITTDRSKAARFVAVMQRGHPRYGVAVNPDKTLVNFDLKFEGKAVPKLSSGAPFPYCGTYIHCTTLNLTKDRDTKKQVVFDTLTVEHTRSPGYHFKRKIFTYFKIQSHHMFFDTSYNSRPTTLRNLHGAFAETANKMWAYMRCMPKAKRPHARVTISTIEELSELAFGILNGKTRTLRWPEYKFLVPKSHLTYIMLHAFLGVLRKKQTGYRDVLAWLQDAIQQLRDEHQPRLPKEFMM